MLDDHPGFQATGQGQVHASEADGYCNGLHNRVWAGSTFVTADYRQVEGFGCRQVSRWQQRYHRMFQGFIQELGLCTDRACFQVDNYVTLGRHQLRGFIGKQGNCDAGGHGPSFLEPTENTPAPNRPPTKAPAMRSTPATIPGIWSGLRSTGPAPATAVWDPPCRW